MSQSIPVRLLGLCHTARPVMSPSIPVRLLGLCHSPRPVSWAYVTQLHLLVSWLGLIAALYLHCSFPDHNPTERSQQHCKDTSVNERSSCEYIFFSLSSLNSV